MLIGEVSRRSGVSSRMLRHYDALGLVTPSVRTASGYREYSADDIRRLFHVECLRTLGLSLTEVKRALDDPGFAPGDMVEQLVRRTRARIAAEQELLRKLERVDAAAPEQWEAVLGIVTLLHALESESGADRQQAVLARYESASLPVDALVAAALTEDDLNVAGALRWSLARAAGAGLADLATGLDSPEVDVRRRAVAAIVDVPTAEATAVLRTALADPDLVVRDRAALALGARRVPEAMAHLLDMVTEGRTDVEAAEMLGLLAPTRAADIVGQLRDRLGSADRSTRLRITQALGEIPAPAARAALAELIADDDRWVAATAAAVLENTRGSSVRNESR